MALSLVETFETLIDNLIIGTGFGPVNQKRYRRIKEALESIDDTQNNP